MDFFFRSFLCSLLLTGCLLSISFIRNTPRIQTTFSTHIMDSGVDNRMQEAAAFLKDEELVEAQEGASIPIAHPALPAVSDDDPFAFDSSTDCEDIPLQLLPTFVEFAKAPKGVSDDIEKVLHGTMMIRKLLSQKRSPPIKEVIDSGVLSAIATYLSFIHDEYPQLQCESTHAIGAFADVASDEQRRYVFDMEKDCVENIMRLLAVTTVESIREHAAWVVGSFARDCLPIRDSLLERGVVDAIVTALRQPVTNLRVPKRCAWAMSTLVRDKPYPLLDQVAAALPALADLIRHDDVSIAQEACQAVSCISYDCKFGQESRLKSIDAVLELNILPRVVELMQVDDPQVQLSALRIIGNLYPHHYYKCCYFYTTAGTFCEYYR